MWMTFGAISLASLLWWGVLWLGLPVHWQNWSPSALMMLHVAPPVIIVTAWRWWQSIREKRKAEAAEAALAAESEAHQAERWRAREAHNGALAERRNAVACRGAWAHAALASEEAPAWLAETPEGALITELALPEAGDVDDDTLAGALTEQLIDVYSMQPGLAYVPLWLCPNPEIDGKDQLDTVRTALEQAHAALAYDPAPRIDLRFTPSGDNLLAACRDQLPDTGALLLAVDTPYLRDLDMGWDEWNPPGEDELERRRWLGAPSWAQVALWLTPNDWPSADEIMDQAGQSSGDVYQPYWEKTLARPATRWNAIPAAFRNDLAGAPVLARLHAMRSTEVTETRAMAMSRTLATLLGDTLIDGALRDYPFSAEDADPAMERAGDVAFLVHNSGDAERGGMRLAALSSALTTHQIEINPIIDASNTVREFGDVGHARELLQLAIATTQAAARAAPVVIGQFDDARTTLHIVQPELAA
ncbi:hypothetical protein ACTSKR_08055 [Chitinibacteraceae bacterium HSL-7]